MVPIHSSAKHAARRGVVLLTSIAVLSMLALLACTFAGVARMERDVSRNHVDTVRARMLATAGVETAVGRLTREVRDPATLTKHRFFGEDMNENGVADPGEDVDGGGWESATCPLLRAPHPSYMMDVNADRRLDRRDLLSVEGAQLGVTGMLAGTYTPQGDLFSVKVSDLSARINVNMTGHPHLQNILENLAESAGLARSVGTRIFQGRPYGSLLEVRDRCRLTAREFEVAKRVLTVYGWSDKEVVNAVPLAQRNRRGLSVGDYVYTWEEVRPRRIDFPRDATGAVVGRCPVNVNEAPREVLVALLRDLAGFWLDEETRTDRVNDGYSFMGVRYSYNADDGSLGRLRRTAPLDRARAERLADAILAHRARTPFRAWQDFNDFLWDEVYQRGLLDRQQIDVIKANFNPNSNINDFNPDSFRFQWVDKTDLDYWTTEWTFGPTGAYEIESIGRVLGHAREVVAEAELLVDVKMFDLYRESTQKDFLQDFWKDGRAIEGSVISRERGAGRTSGSLALMTYPEMPVRDRVKDADYDGYVTLSTKQSLGASAAFRASFYDRGLDADTGQPRVPDVNGPYDARLLDQRGGSGSSRAGKLFPDGAYSELDSVPMYNFAPQSTHDFYTSFWLKPHFFPEHAGRTRVFLTWQTWAQITRVPILPLGVYCTVTDHIEEGSNGGYDYQEPWDTPAFLAGGCVDNYEGCVATPCLNHREHNHRAIDRAGETWGTVFEGGKWVHVGWVHNGPVFEGRDREWEPLTHHEDLDTLYVNGRKVAGLFAYQTCDNFSPSSYAGERLRLGEQRSGRSLNSVPDSTMDEVLVWNHVQMPQAEQRILDEFNDGRFYNEDDGRFTSREIDLAAAAGVPTGTPLTIGMVSWTRYVPESLAGGRVEIDLVKASDGRPLTGTHTYSEPGGEKVDAPAGEKIRYVVRFEPGVGGVSPIVDTPIFDDITISICRGPVFLSWAWVTTK